MISRFWKKNSDNWKYLNKNLAYPYECFKSIDDYQKLVKNF